GLLAVSTKVITTEPQSVERIFRIAQINGGKWTILLNPKMKTHLDKIMSKNYGAFNAKLNSEEIKFFEEDSWKQQRHGNNEVDTLYWALLISYRVIAVNENPPRHCVLIIHKDEIQLPHSQIPGQVYEGISLNKDVNEEKLEEWHRQNLSQVFSHVRKYDGDRIIDELSQPLIYDANQKK
ncbi:15325_t:CDS:2, partial [Racocetra persica]